MRILSFGLPLGCLATLALTAAILAEPGDGDGGKGDKPGKGGKGDFGDRGPGKGGKGDFGDKAGKGGPGGRGRALTVDDIVDHLMSFDKNKTGKLTKDMLPERMHTLFARGDTNKDGVLDRDEVRKLAGDLVRDGDFRGFDGVANRGGPGGPGRGGPANGPRPGSLVRAVDDLKLNDKTRDKAEAVIKAHEDNVRKLMETARADMLVKMKEVLSEKEFKDFKDAVERQPAGPAGRPVGGPPPRPEDRTAELDRKLDDIQKQFQKQLDDLRRDLRR